MFILSHVTNTVLHRARNEGRPMSPMKLQKLLFFWYMDYLKHCPDQALFSERFEPWPYGPVVADVYYAFKDYGSRPIKSYHSDPDGKDYFLQIEDEPALRKSFDRVWDTFIDYNGIELSQRTHRENSAWYKAWRRGDTFLSDEEIRSDYDIEFGEVLNES